MFGLGFLLHTTLYKSLKARAPSPAAFEGNALLAAFGIMYIIQYLSRLRWGNWLLPTQYLTDKVAFPGIPLQLSQIIAFAVAAGLGIAVYLFLTRSKPGRAIRATAEDPATAGLMGVNTSMILAFCFGLGALLAGIAGTLISLSTSISSGIGFSNTVIALIVVVLGGLGSVPGSFIAGIIIGIVTTMVTNLWEPVLVVPVYYGILMVLLLVRPAGILGKKSCPGLALIHYSGSLIHNLEGREFKEPQMSLLSDQMPECRQGTGSQSFYLFQACEIVGDRCDGNLIRFQGA